MSPTQAKGGRASPLKDRLCAGILRPTNTPHASNRSFSCRHTRPEQSPFILHVMQAAGRSEKVNTKTSHAIKPSRKEGGNAAGRAAGHASINTSETRERRSRTAYKRDSNQTRSKQKASTCRSAKVVCTRHTRRLQRPKVFMGLCKCQK